MSDPLVASLKSLLITQDTAAAPSEGTPSQITADTVTQTTITSADLSATTNSNYVWHVFEALDGDCRGQMVLCTAFNEASDQATVTSFRVASPTTTQFKHWEFSWPVAVATDDGTTTTTISDLRTETNNAWLHYYMLSLAGENTDLKNITDFTASSDTFTHDAFDNGTLIGDMTMPVQPLQPDSVEVVVDAGTPLEREIITDSLDPEGIVVGAIEEATVTFSAELRGLASAASDGTTALPPAEMHVALSSVFTETLNTGDNVASWSGPTLTVDDGTAFSEYTMALLNGEVFGITAIATNDLTTQTGHIVNTPVADDVVYGGANYKPKDSGWTSSSFLCWYGEELLLALTGGLPEIGVSIEGNAIAHYNCTYQCVGGFAMDVTKPHDDIYDTSTPLVGKGNVSRVVFDGTVLDGDVLSCEFTLLDAPVKKNAAFTAFENNGGLFYTSRTGSCTMVVQMEDSEYWQRYRAMQEVDLLVQVGSIATAAWGCWSPRAQLVEAPEISEADGLFQITLNLRFLRPTTQGQPAYVLAHF